MFRLFQDTLDENQRLKQDMHDIKTLIKYTERHLLDIKAAMHLEKSIPPQLGWPNMTHTLILPYESYTWELELDMRIFRKLDLVPMIHFSFDTEKAIMEWAQLYYNDLLQGVLPNEDMNQICSSVIDFTSSLGEDIYDHPGNNSRLLYLWLWLKAMHALIIVANESGLLPWVEQISSGEVEFDLYPECIS
jgi:hypothetical protein